MKDESVLDILSEMNCAQDKGFAYANRISEWAKRIRSAHERECLDPLFAKDLEMNRLRRLNADLYAELVTYSQRNAVLKDAMKPISTCKRNFKAAVLQAQETFRRYK